MKTYIASVTGSLKQVVLLHLEDSPRADTFGCAGGISEMTTAFLCEYPNSTTVGAPDGLVVGLEYHY